MSETKRRYEKRLATSLRELHSYAEGKAIEVMLDGLDQAEAEEVTRQLDVHHNRITTDITDLMDYQQIQASRAVKED